MSEELNPVIHVHVSPAKVSKGQMISITANIVNRQTLVPMNFDTIFMEIIDEDGIPVWPLSLMEEESATFSKLISTSSMDAGKKYQVRISPSRKLRPLGAAFFEVDRKLIDPALLVPGALLIPPLIIATIESTRKEKSESHVVIPSSPQMDIAWLIYRTERDAKVCQFCRPFEGKRYRPNDADLPKVPIHINCRCHFDIITIQEEEEIYSAMMAYQIYQDNIEEMQVMEAYVIAKNHWRKS